MEKLKSLFVLVGVLSVGVACSRDALEMTDGGTRVAYVNVSRGGGGAMFRSTIDPSTWAVSWALGDEIYYYTLPKSSGSSVSRYVVSAVEGSVVKLPVSYKEGDNTLLLVNKGRSVGAVTSGTASSFVLDDGVPSSQTGNFADSHISVGKAVLLGLADSSPNITLKPVQAFLKFTMSDLTYGDKEVNYIEVTTGKITTDGTPVKTDICGSLKVTVDGDPGAWTYSTALDGTAGNTITVDKSNSGFIKDTDYYVAVLPNESYADGFAIRMCRKEGTSEPDVLATVFAKKSDFSMEEGSVMDLGDLSEEKKITVRYKSATLYPNDFVAISRDRDTKQFWLSVKPSDWAGTVTWETTNTDNFSITVDKNADGTPKKVDFEVDGKKLKCYHITLNPKGTISADETYTTTVRAVLTSDDNVGDVKECPVEIGDWVYLGYKNKEGKKILYGWRYLTGNRDALSWAEEGGRTCGAWMYGLLDNYRDKNYTTMKNAYTAVYGSYNLANGVEYNKYNDDDGLFELELEDDFVNQYLGSDCRIPSTDDGNILYYGCSYEFRNKADGASASHPEVRYTSLLPAYKDVHLDLGLIGRWDGANFLYIDTYVNILCRTLGGFKDTQMVSTIHMGKTKSDCYPERWNRDQYAFPCLPVKYIN